MEDGWKYGKDQWERKDNCFVDSLSVGSYLNEKLLGPNDKPGPGSLGFDPKDQFQSPSGTEVCKNIEKSVVHIFNLDLYSAI